MDLLQKRRPAYTWMGSNPADFKIFVRTPKHQTMALMVDPSDSVLKIKMKIQREAMLPSSRAKLTDGSWYPFPRQRLSFLGRLLEDDETLAGSHIPKDSTLQLTMLWPAACIVVVRILPGTRFIDLEVTEGLQTTIGDVKVLICAKEGRDCEELYLGDPFSERLADNVTLEACHIPEQNLVWVQSPTAFHPRGPSHRNTQRNRGTTAPTFEDEFTLLQITPRSGDAGQSEIPEAPEQVPCQATAPDYSMVIALRRAMLQSHEDRDRIVSRMQDESNKLLVDPQLQSYPSLLSLVRDDQQILEQELTEHQGKFARDLSRLIDENHNFYKQLRECQRKLLVVLDENRRLQEESTELRNELDTVTAELQQQKEESLCVICFDRPRDTLVLGCLHCHFCSQCLEKHQESNSTCPSCRGLISGKLIYRKPL